MDVIRLSIYETYSLTRMRERIFTVVKAKFRLCVFVHKDNSNTSLRVTKVTSVNASHIHMALSRTFLERVCFMLIVCQRFFSIRNELMQRKENASSDIVLPLF